MSFALFLLYHVVLSLCGGCGCGWVGVGGIPSDYLVSTQLQLWLFCCWGCGCCWAVTINLRLEEIPIGPNPGLGRQLRQQKELQVY